MVFSYYLYKYPYKLIWQLLRLCGRNPDIVFYCGDPIDYVTFKPIQKYLPPIPIVAKNDKTAKYLRQLEVSFKRMPVFPKTVIMCRQASHKFPEEKIFIITFSHGVHRFKKIKLSHFDRVDITFETSPDAADYIRSLGFENAIPIGFPKLDPAFDGTYDNKKLEAFRKKANVDGNKQTIIFTATWDKSGMSAIEQWVDKIHTLGERYNVLVTVHSWTSKRYIEKLRNMKGIYFVEDPNAMAYLLISEVLIGDSSSIIAEFCALDRPIITFRVPDAPRSSKNIRKMLSEVSYQIDRFEELPEMIEHALQHPEEKSEMRQKYNHIMFDRLDGKAGERAAGEILKRIT